MNPIKTALDKKVQSGFLEKPWISLDHLLFEEGKYIQFPMAIIALDK